MTIGHLVAEVPQRRTSRLCNDSEFVAAKLGNEVFDMHGRIFAQRKKSVKPRLCMASIPSAAWSWLNAGMNKHDYRKQWLRALKDKEGSTDALASKIGTDPNYISSILGPNAKRKMGDQVARQIERTYDLSPGVLDMPSEGAQKIVKATEGMDSEMLEDVLQYIAFKKANRN